METKILGTIYLLLFTLIFDEVLSKRYKYCSEGCCTYEFCAYHTICYPIIHCDPECPDGSCKNGLCMPTKPCQNNHECGMARACTTNYNLGYNTCQYNLDIGKTLCVDRYGHYKVHKDT